MQAPIEISTYDQLSAILTFGVYHFSCKYHQIFYSNKEVFNLKIEGCSDSKQKIIVYTLDDLKDLESKIILIRDSRSSIVNDQSSETQSSKDTQKGKLNLSTSSDISLVEKLSSQEVEEFLNVRRWLCCMHIYVGTHVIVIPWAQVVCLICIPEARGLRV